MWFFLLPFQCKHLIIFVSSVTAVFLCFVNYVCCQDWPLIYWHFYIWRTYWIMGTLKSCLSLTIPSFLFSVTRHINIFMDIPGFVSMKLLCLHLKVCFVSCINWTFVTKAHLVFPWLVSNCWALCPFLTHYISVQLQIEEISRKLRTGELGIPVNPEERCASMPNKTNNHLCSA